MAVKLVKEIVSGAGATLALDAAGGNGLRYQRVWKIILENAVDINTIDVRNYIGVTVGSPHPANVLCVCDSVDLKPDGDSRHVYIVTATYSSTPLSLTAGGYGGQDADPRTQAPDARKANWSTETTTVEVPSWGWRPVGQANWQAAKNPVGDLYDGVTIVQPVVSIKVEQMQINDPNNFAMYVGYVNTNAFTIGALQCFPRSVMLRGVSATPHVEVVGSRAFRGWKASFEFMYKPGHNNYLGKFLGWDVAIPVSGFNVLNVAGAQGRADVEVGSLALTLADENLGTIKNWPNPTIEPTLVGKKSRANVLVSAPRSKAAQRPSPQPVALNLDGTPRNSSLDPLLAVYQVYPDFDMSTMRLKLA